jgi:hypothetical protein
LKKNQGNLYKRVDNLFKGVLPTVELGYQYSSYSIEGASHGRTENRYYQVLNNISLVK